MKYRAILTLSFEARSRSDIAAKEAQLLSLLEVIKRDFESGSLAMQLADGEVESAAVGRLTS